MSIEMHMQGAVAVVTINRPQKKNALTHSMRAELADLMQRLQDNAAVRALVITGAGADFSAGGDVSEMGNTSVAESLARTKALQRLVCSIASIDKPVIAAVRGACSGLAWSMALAADFIIAANDARFQFAFRNIGLAGDGAAAFFLTRYVGLQRAKELLYSGRAVRGTEAAQLGLALEAVPSDAVVNRALELAHGYAEGPTVALSMMKRQFNAASMQTVAEAVDFELSSQSLMSRTADFQEGIAAFREKRSPLFKGA